MRSISLEQTHAPKRHPALTSSKWKVVTHARDGAPIVMTYIKCKAPSLTKTHRQRIMLSQVCTQSVAAITLLFQDIWSPFRSVGLWVFVWWQMSENVVLFKLHYNITDEYKLKLNSYDRLWCRPQYQVLHLAVQNFCTWSVQTFILYTPHKYRTDPSQHEWL